MNLTVIIPTHNPRPEVFVETLAALQRQTLPVDQWELIVVDNASVPPVQIDLSWHPFAKIIREKRLGLTSARECGFLNSTGEVLVLVDDDNLLHSEYLNESLELMTHHQKIGALGGKSLPRFEQTPPSWWEPHLEFLLACRDLGDTPQLSDGLFREDLQRNDYPSCAPHGAGMVIRREALERWLKADIHKGGVSDRRGAELTSGGDNDIVLSIMQDNWAVAYFPTLSLIHLIPTSRIQLGYLQRLNRGIAKSWVQVLHKHQACPWPRIASWTVPLRKIKAWFIQKAWQGPVAKIRWHGICGHFEGLASIPRT